MTLKMCLTCNIFKPKVQALRMTYQRDLLMLVSDMLINVIWYSVSNEMAFVDNSISLIMVKC